MKKEGSKTLKTARKRALEGFGWCERHEDAVSEETYRWKGCWGCHHFWEGKSYPYFSVAEASSELGVSESTVRRWIRKGKLEAELFKQGRYTAWLPSPKRYHIKERNLEKMKLKTKRARKCKHE